MTSGDAWVRRNPAYRAVVNGWPAHGFLACSGGVDSSALLVLAGIGVRRHEIAPFVVVHVDHLTRSESATEGEAVEQLASRYGLRTFRTVVNPADAVGATSSPEDRWRTQRYAALARAAHDLGTRSVVTAHTRDDQVETILIRLLSGAGGLAVAGMASHSILETANGEIEIYRPLLETSRDELLDVLRRADIAPLNDPSNIDRAFRRNAIRLDIIPRLRQVFPGFEDSLVRTGTLAARDAEALDMLASNLMSTIATCRDHETRVDRAALRAADPAIATRIIRWAAIRLMPDNPREMSFERTESVRKALAGRTGAMIELPYSVVVHVGQTEIIFERRNI